MSLSATDALRDGIEDFTRPPVAAAVAVFTLFGVFTSMVIETAVLGVVETILGLLPFSYDELYTALAESGRLPGTVGPVDTGIFEAGPATLFPLGVDLVSGPLAVVLGVLAWLALAVLSELVYLLAVRGAAGERFAGSPFSRLHFVLVHGILAGLVTMVLVFSGALAFVLPGLIFAVLFSFVPQAVALEEVNAFRAIADSVGLVWENALRVFALGLLVFVAQFAVLFGVGTISIGPWVDQFVGSLFKSLFVVLWITVATEAYCQVRADRARTAP